jgi:hypothetical protein
MDAAPVASKTYVGDGVYADWNRGELILTTEDGIRVTNVIVLEPTVLQSLIDYLRHVRAIR